MFDIVKDTATLRDLYPFLEEGVAEINRKAPGHVSEIAPDVYAALKAGEVTLAVLLDGDVLWGWTVFYRSTAIDCTSTVVSWMTYLRPGAPKQMLEDVITETETIAVNTDCEKIQFVTGRYAWGRRLRPYGYRLGGLIFEKEVDHG